MPSERVVEDGTDEEHRLDDICLEILVYLSNNDREASTSELREQLTPNKQSNSIKSRIRNHFSPEHLGWIHQVDRLEPHGEIVWRLSDTGQEWLNSYEQELPAVPSRRQAIHSVESLREDLQKFDENIDDVQERLAEIEDVLNNHGSKINYWRNKSQDLHKRVESVQAKSGKHASINRVREVAEDVDGILEHLEELESDQNDLREEMRNNDRRIEGLESGMERHRQYLVSLRDVFVEFLVGWQRVVNESRIIGRAFRSLDADSLRRRLQSDD